MVTVLLVHIMNHIMWGWDVKPEVTYSRTLLYLKKYVSIDLLSKGGHSIKSVSYIRT